MIRETGKYKNLGETRYFTPFSLPPKNPTLLMNEEIIRLYGEASFSLGQLNEMSKRLPDPERFLRAYAVKEAMLSSSIEGINTTITDVFQPIATKTPLNKETQLVVNYFKCMKQGLSSLIDEDHPIVSRIILNMHRTLFTASGSASSPGEFRKQSVRVGNLVPPPANEIHNLMSALEQFINTPNGIPEIIKAGLVHAHFEMIHPFLDGNGRIGRMIIVLMLVKNRLIESPILYPSLYFKKNHNEYYLRLDEIRTKGDFESWISFYLQVIRDSALDAHQRAKKIEQLEIELKEKISQEEPFQRIQKNAFLVLEYLFKYPISMVGNVAKNIGMSFNATQMILNRMLDAGIVSSKDQTRNRLYTLDSYLETLEIDLS